MEIRERCSRKGATLLSPQSDLLSLTEDTVISAGFVGLGTTVLSSGPMKPFTKHFLATLIPLESGDSCKYSNSRIRSQ